MSLATRCPHCLTAFRIVPDHLRLAQGWVRCGRCEEVFLASRHLLEGGSDGSAAAMVSTPPEESRTHDGSAPINQPRIPPLEPELRASTTLRESERQEPPEPTLESPYGPPIGELMGPTGQPPFAADVTTPADLPMGAPPAHWDAQASPSVPEGRYSWERRSGRTRAAPSGAVVAIWTAILVLSVVGLAAQALHTWRDHLAAALPAARPVLQAWCGLARCRIEPLRRVGAWSVESSQLRQLGGTVYRLEVVIRNRADLPLMVPWLDLVLTDAQGQVISRRALELTDLGVRSRLLGSGHELAILTSVNAGTDQVAGYTIELFHP